MYRDWVEKHTNTRDRIAPNALLGKNDVNTLVLDVDEELGQDLDFFLLAYRNLVQRELFDNSDQEIERWLFSQIWMQKPDWVGENTMDWFRGAHKTYDPGKRRLIRFVEYGDVVVSLDSMSASRNGFYSFYRGTMISRRITESLSILEILTAQYGDNRAEAALKEMDNLLRSVVHNHPKKEALLRKWHAFRKEFDA